MIPTSAHGTNPASANMAGFNVEYVNTDKVGGIDLDDLKKKVCSSAYIVNLLFLITNTVCIC